MKHLEKYWKKLAKSKSVLLKPKKYPRNIFSFLVEEKFHLKEKQRILETPPKVATYDLQPGNECL